MRTTLKKCVAVLGVLLVVAVIGLIISRGPIYGQAGADNWVPDLTGEWTGELTGYYYDHVTDPACVPQYFKNPFEHNLIITNQTGRVFAGALVNTDDPSEPGKVAGVILPDRTVSIQIFDPSELRLFITGRMKASGETLEISGYGHMFDDFGSGSNLHATMASMYIRLVKVD